MGYIVSAAGLGLAIVSAADGTHGEFIALADVHLLHVIVYTGCTLGLEETVGVDSVAIGSAVVEPEVVVELVGNLGYSTGKFVEYSSVRFFVQEFLDGKLEHPLAQGAFLIDCHGAAEFGADERYKRRTVITSIVGNLDGHGLLFGGGFA